MKDVTISQKHLKLEMVQRPEDRVLNELGK